MRSLQSSVFRKLIPAAMFFAVFSCDSVRDESGAFSSEDISFNLTVGSTQDLSADQTKSFDAVDDLGETVFRLTESVCPTGSCREDTKAALISGASAVGSFGVCAFKSDGSSYFGNVSPTKSGDVWETSHKWPTSGSLSFLARYPADLPIKTLTATNVVFDHTVPELSTNQSEIMLSYSPNLTSGTVPVNFAHALASVKFKVKSMASDITRITAVRLENVYHSGTCSPVLDSPITTFNWSDKTGTDFAVRSETQKSMPIGDLGEEYTFLLIPQTLSAKAVTVVFTIQDNAAAGSTVTKTVRCTLNSGSWDAGKTYTYNISYSDDLGLLIQDSVSATLKQDLVIRNTGSVSQYIRVAVVGNWFDASGDIVAPWSISEGTLTGLDTTNWILNNGMYYYKHPVAAGQTIPHPLFTSYSPGTVPVVGAHLEMQIVAQAVEFDSSKIYITGAWGATAASIVD